MGQNTGGIPRSFLNPTLQLKSQTRLKLVVLGNHSFIRSQDLVITQLIEK